LDRYLIQIDGPANFGESHLYDTNKYGSGSVRVYKVMEGRTPSLSEVGHIIEVGSFTLKENSNKTKEEFMKEIRDGVASLVS